MVNKLFLVIISVLVLYLYLSLKIYNTLYNKDIAILIISFLGISFITIISIIISYNVIPTTKNIVPEVGNKGVSGLRGKSGGRAECSIKCSDDMCYRKVMDHITSVYNLWSKVHNLPQLGKGKYIRNLFIKHKVKEICNSKIFSDLIVKYGSHKLDIHGNPLNKSQPKCDINTDCGAYDYIFQKWTEWILIILKYKNGKLFLDSENLNDNDFNNMISDVDLKTTTDTYNNTPITKEWIFNMDYSLDDIINPPEEKKEEIDTYFYDSIFYKFYTYSGVPDAYNIDNKDISSKLKLKSPFEIIKLYDAWYWGANPLASPKLLQKCKYDINKIEDITKDKIKVKLTNNYDKIWSSNNARQAYIKNFCHSPGNCSNLYLPYNNKGDKPIDIYKPKDFYDNDEDIGAFKSYKPINNIMIESNNEVNNSSMKNSKNDCYPKLTKKSYDSYPSNFKENGPKNLTLLVSGDTKHPVDFEKVYSSKRVKGFNANKVGYSFWRPIPPKGYKCLGDIIDKNPFGIKPNKNSIVCLPEKCVERANTNANRVWSTKEKESQKYITDSTGKKLYLGAQGSIVDTDNSNNVSFLSHINTNIPDQYFDENKNSNISKLNPFLNKTNSFRGNSNEFYKINPKCIYDSEPKLAEKQPINIKVAPKLHKKYSILNIYDE